MFLTYNFLHLNNNYDNKATNNCNGQVWSVYYLFFRLCSMLFYNSVNVFYSPLQQMHLCLSLSFPSSPKGVHKSVSLIQSETNWKNVPVWGIFGAFWPKLYFKSKFCTFFSLFFLFSSLLATALFPSAFSVLLSWRSICFHAEAFG